METNEDKMVKDIKHIKMTVTFILCEMSIILGFILGYLIGSIFIH